METANLNQKNKEIPVINTQPPKRRTIGKWLTLAVVVLLVGGTSLFVALRNSDPKSAQAAPIATVNIAANGFQPQAITIKKGQSVTWVNKDSRAHEVVASPTSDQASLNSGTPLAEEESYTAVFEEAGTFTYSDKLDPANYKGTVIVE